jgi:hypothetical protein
LFGDARAWVCSQATGDVLEIAIGTGLNLLHYPQDVRLTGVDVSTQMLKHARRARRHVPPQSPTGDAPPHEIVPAVGVGDLMAECRHVGIGTMNRVELWSFLTLSGHWSWKLRQWRS